jgi:hypothetical protein
VSRAVDFANGLDLIEMWEGMTHHFDVRVEKKVGEQQLDFVQGPEFRSDERP